MSQTMIGRRAEHERLSKLAEPRGFVVYDEAADPDLHEREPEWLVLDKAQRKIYGRTSADEVAAFLSSKPLVSDPE